MSFRDDEQQTGPVVELPSQEPEARGRQEPAPEPRLLTRADRKSGDGTAATRRGTVAPRQTQTYGTTRIRLPQRPGRTAKQSRRLRTLSALALGSALLLVLTATGVVMYLRHAIQVALPQVDGTVHAAGLLAPVTVARDAQGVPVMVAANLPDLLFAQGYVTAGDRLWQMDTLRRHAAGELAEILGSSLVEHDRRQRYLQMRAAADRAAAQLSADQRSELEAYSRGVNAYVDAHRSTLPLQFRLLKYSPAAWTPRDSLLVSLAMWQDLSTEFPRKMDREALSAHVPVDLLPDLYPVGSWRDQPPAAQGRDLTAPHDVEQIPLDPSQSQLHPMRSGASAATLLAVSAALSGSQRCDGCRSGSNNWAVSGAHTASGAPLLSNDMHLSLSIPDIWYEISLHADLETETSSAGASRIDVAGFTLPGVPFVIVGRNARVAWGITNLGADVQDLRVEHLRGSGDETEFEQTDGTWAAAGHHAETIHVRGGRDVVLDVVTTSHGAPGGTMETPVISPLYPGEQRSLSLAWTVYDPAALSDPFLAVNTAQDGPALMASMAHFGGPALNLVWADAGGHIGYHAVGMIPVRGPAVQHPRAVSPLIVSPGATPLDEGSEEPENPAITSIDMQPHLVLSAFRPLRRRPARTAARPRRTAARVAKPVAESQPATAVENIAPAKVAVNYTIGSSISPVPVDALDAQQAWTAYVPYEALPAVTDPKNGLLATANARVSTEDDPYALAVDWADPFRVERIVHLLTERRGLVPEDMLRMETDVYSDVNRALSQRLAYAVDHASARVMGSDATKLHSAANLLRDWDGRMRTDSAAAAIVSTVREALWPALLTPQIAAHDGSDPQQAAEWLKLYTWAERSSALELLIQNEPARWLPKGYGNWNDFLAATIASALKGAHAPGNLAKWQYGQVHRVEIAEPLLGAHRTPARVLGIRTSSGGQPAPGDATTIDAIGAHFGPSERFTADLSSTEAALANITTGESGNPGSPWYFDQFRAWMDGRSFSLPGVTAEPAHSVTLVP